MRKTTQAVVLAISLAATLALGVGSPAVANPVDRAQDTATGQVAINNYNAAAIVAEATAAPSADNVSCGFVEWAGANTKRVVVPGVNTTHGQDAATASAECSDIDVTNTNPPNFTAFLDVTFQYLQAGTTNTWVNYHTAGCQRPAVRGHAPLECTVTHQFEDPSDPIQSRPRRCSASASSSQG
ncbi:MAG: hypothetical protein ACRDT6_00180 [Micromonosporaceae bacterium]